MDLPLTMNFDPTRMLGSVSIGSEASIPNLHEYFISPEYLRNDDGTYQVIGYSLIHRTQLPTAAVMEQRERDLGIFQETA